jgi:regulator of RNase E activity RraB
MNIDKFGSTSVNSHSKGGLGMDFVCMSEEEYEKNSGNTNICSPTESSDTALKAYVDHKTVLLQQELYHEVEKMKQRFDGMQDFYEKFWQDVIGRDATYITTTEWHELFKEEIKHQKNKLINSLLDLISGKIKKTSPLEDKDPEKIYKLELLAVLEEWRK